jgi:hypothetical protein
MHINIVCPQSFGSLFYLGTLMKQLLNGARVTLSKVLPAWSIRDMLMYGGLTLRQ